MKILNTLDVEDIPEFDKILSNVGKLINIDVNKEKVPLSIAYSFSALAMVIVPTLTSQIFYKKLSLFYWLEAVLIIIGIIIILKVNKKNGP